jgi:hypothetical protein
MKRRKNSGTLFTVVVIGITLLILAIARYLY